LITKMELLFELLISLLLLQIYLNISQHTLHEYLQ